MTQLSVQTSRRRFVQGCALTAAGLTINKGSSYFPFGKISPEEANRQAQVVIYQDKAHFDSTGLLEPYKAPINSASSTRQYVERVDATTFLSRHWFV